MAEESAVVTNETEVIETPEVETVTKAEYDELNAKLSQYKKSIDKLTKEAAEKKREERARMSEEERTRAEQIEELARLKEEKEEREKELNHLKAVNAYKDIDEETVEKLIDSINDKDHSSIHGIIQKIVEKAIKEKETEWKKSRPDAVVGDGSYPTMTAEQAKAKLSEITDPDARDRFIQQYYELL